jgi:hypothetical protein
MSSDAMVVVVVVGLVAMVVVVGVVAVGLVVIGVVVMSAELKDDVFQGLPGIERENACVSCTTHS